MFFLFFLFTILQIAYAEEILVRIAVDDRQLQRLSEPQMQVGEARFELTDDGTQTADVPNDSIFVGQAELPKRDAVSLKLWDGEEEIGTLEVSVPKLSEVTFQLKTTKTGIILDLNAPLMPSMEAVPYSKAEDIVLVQAKAVKKEEIKGAIKEGLNQIRLSIDASETPLTAPIFVLSATDKSTRLFDDGALDGDEKGDQIWCLEKEFSPTEFLEGAFYDGAKLLGRVKIALPSAQVSKASLVYNQFGLMIKNAKLRTADAVVEDSLVVQAAPKGEAVSSSNDQIALTVYLDDRLLQKLKAPILAVEQEGVELVSFLDEGTGGDETAGDHLLIAKLLIARSEYAQIMISDQDEEQGTLRVFLPSTSEAVVWLRTSENGVKLISEPTPTKATVSPAGEGTGTGTSTTQVSADKLAHVLWVGIALFAIGFAYVRRSIHDRWEQEVKPILVKMEQFIDMESQTEKKAEQEKGDENDAES